MDPFLSDRHARWHPVDLSLFPLRRYSPPPASLHHREIPSTSSVRYNPDLHRGPGPEPLRPRVPERSIFFLKEKSRPEKKSSLFSI